MITLSWLLIIGLLGGILALIDGIIRVRGRGTAIVAVIEIIVAALFILSFFVVVPFGVSDPRDRAADRAHRAAGRCADRPVVPASTITVVAIVLTLIWLVLAQGWIVIPGVN